MKRAHDVSRDIIIKVALEVVLTKDERLNEAKLMADAINHRSRLIEDLEGFRLQKKAEIQAQDAIVAAKTVLVNSGKEFRLVECRVDFEWDKAIKHIYRMDNGDHVRSEPITNEERQQLMPGIATGPDRKSQAAGE